MTYGFDLEKFSERLRKLREGRKLSAMALGKSIGVSYMSVIRWETEKRIPNIKHIYDLAAFFNVTADYLIGKDG